MFSENNRIKLEIRMKEKTVICPIYLKNKKCTLKYA